LIDIDAHVETMKVDEKGGSGVRLGGAKAKRQKRGSANVA
jgi:hypothetical protein